MSASGHTSEQLAAFLGSGGDTRFIVAAYRSAERAGELFLLDDNTVDEQLRTFTRNHLRCPMPTCAAPDIVAVSRFSKRDGFAHRAGSGGRHAPESLNHLQGKAVIARWLRHLLGPAAVQVEAASDTQRQRVADVMATLPDGSRVAFEVQYAAISVAEWRARHDSYAQQGIVDVWMWGHARLKRASPTDEEFWLDEAQEAVRVAGLPVLFLNPLTAQVAIATQESDVGSMLAAGRYVTPLIVPLDSLHVTPTGLAGGPLPTLRARAEHRRRVLEQEAQRRRQDDAERQKRYAAAAAKRREQHERFMQALPPPQRLYPPPERAPTPPPPAKPREPKPAPPRCSWCGLPVAPYLKSGRHVTCPPVRE